MRNRLDFPTLRQLRAFAAVGATIVTHALNKPYYDKVLTAPHTLAPDTLMDSGKKLVFETLTTRKILTDGTRSIEVASAGSMKPG